MAQNLTIKRGDTITLTLTITQSNAAYNLTGATVRMTAKYDPTDADNAAVFSLSSPSSGIVLTNAAGGIATITIAHSNTSTLPGVRVPLYYDVQVTDSSNKVFTVVDGILTVDPDISITTP